jgi:glycosyltransferase involved in cell wall biosynthesis
VIDDGSTDNTGEIIDHIAEKANGRLNIIHQTNGSLSISKDEENLEN